MPTAHLKPPSSGAPDSVSSVPSQRQQRSATIAGMLLGLGGTFVFYLVAPWVAKLFAGGPEFVQRYFCGHPLEYITSAMFFIGMGILATKLRLLPVERRALKSILERAYHGAWVKGSAKRAEVIDSLTDWQKQSRAAGVASTTISRRLHDVPES